MNASTPSGFGRECHIGKINNYRPRKPYNIIVFIRISTAQSSTMDCPIESHVRGPAFAIAPCQNVCTSCVQLTDCLSRSCLHWKGLTMLRVLHAASVCTTARQHWPFASSTV